MRSRVLRTLIVALTLSSCTSDGVMRPDVDVGTQTSALTPPAPVDVYAAPVQDMVAADPGLDAGVPLASETEQYAMMSVPQPQAPTPQMSMPQEPITVPDGPDPRTDQLLGPVKKPSAIAAGFSRMVNPFGFGKGGSNAGMPSDESDCRKQLRKIGVTYRDLPPIQKGDSCSVPYPVEVSGLPGGAKLKPAATLNCQMALTFATWVKKELQPAARARYWSGVDTITQASSYSCRRMVGAGTNKMSEHSKGNAIDIAKIELNNGKDILVRKKGFFAFREKGLLNTVRADGCDYFSTVLGPGYNKEHADHFHFDLMHRKNGYTACR